METRTVTIGNGEGPRNGEHVVRIVTTDGRDFGPLGIVDSWRVDGFHADGRSSVGNVPPHHARIMFGTSYTDVPHGSRVTLA